MIFCVCFCVRVFQWFGFGLCKDTWRLRCCLVQIAHDLRFCLHMMFVEVSFFFGRVWLEWFPCSDDGSSESRKTWFLHRSLLRPCPFLREFHSRYMLAITDPLQARFFSGKLRSASGTKFIGIYKSAARGPATVPYGGVSSGVVPGCLFARSWESIGQGGVDFSVGV